MLLPRSGRSRTWLLNQVDQKHNPRTIATVSQLIDRRLDVIDVETSTKQGYVRPPQRWWTSGVERIATAPPSAGRSVTSEPWSTGMLGS